MSFRIIIGDAREELKKLPSESVHCCVTSPPYWGLRDYGVAGQIGMETTFDAFNDELVAVFREVRRVLRADGTLWLNLGDSYNNATTSGRKPTATGKHGYWENPAIAQRINANQMGLKPKDLVGIPWRVAFALQADGWYLRQDIIWSKPNPMPESIRDRCTKAHEYLFLLSKSERYFYDADAIKEDAETEDLRRPYGSPGANMLDPRDAPQGQGKPRKIKMPDGWDTGPGGHGSFHRNGREKGRYRDSDAPTVHGNKPGRSDGGAACNKPGQLTRNKRSVWEIATSPFPEAHFATFPPALIDPCIKAGCPEGGTVLDPFGGAGTTGLVADRLQRNAILIELNPDYAAMAERRIRDDAPLFAEAAE